MYLVCWIEDDKRIWEPIDTENEDIMNEELFYLSKRLNVDIDYFLVFNKKTELSYCWRNKNVK
jgi:hypothetical protein